MRELLLSGFEIVTQGVSLTPKFDPHISIYGVDVAADAEEIVFKPIADAEMYYTLKSRDYERVTKEREAVGDAIVLSSADFEEHYVNLDLTLVRGEEERTVTFRITKWYSAEQLRAQPYRAQYHITPPTNYMNDPNGLVYDPTDGYHHFCYQYSPQMKMGKQSWGHMRSKDLVHWEQLPLALQMDEIGRMYSGSAMSLSEEEGNNPAIYDGIFADNKPGESRLVLFYTNAGVDQLQRQMTAYSKDHGVTWTKYNGGKPILDNDCSTSGRKFGDPKVFKIPGDDKHWYMATCAYVQLFASEDLIRWTKVQDMKYKDGVDYPEAPGGVLCSECPGVNPVLVEGTSERKWIYSGADGYYVVGDFVWNEETGYFNWVAESDRIEPQDNTFIYWNKERKDKRFGKYAGMTFYEDGTGKGRTVGASWLIDQYFEGKPCVGVQSVLYEWKLRRNADGTYTVLNFPIDEVKALRGETLFSKKGITVKSDDANILEGIRGAYLDVEAEISVCDAVSFEFAFHKGEGQATRYTVDVPSRTVTLDVSTAIMKREDGIFTQSVSFENGKISLRLLIDQGAVEAFANGGESNISTAVTTDITKDDLAFSVSGGSVRLERLSVWRMRSMYE